MKDKVSLVTGGAGFIGSHIAQDLLAMGHNVVVVDNLEGGNTSNIPQGAVFENADVCIEAAVDYLFDRYEIEYVYHCAAYAAEGLSHHIPRFNYDNNLMGSVNLIKNSIRHNVRHFTFLSSIAVYGAAPIPWRETDKPEPIDPYGAAKLAVEHHLKSVRHYYGLPYTIYRAHNVYGPRQNIADPYRNVIGIFMHQLLKNKPITIFGNGLQRREFSYVRDITPTIARSPMYDKAANQTFNIGSSRGVSVRKLSEMVMEAMGIQGDIQYLTSRKEVHRARCTHWKIDALLQTSNDTPLDVGLRKMAAWAKEQPIQPTEPFARIEIESNLPESWKAMQTGT